MNDILKHIREIVGQTIHTLDVQDGYDPNSPHAIFVSFSSDSYFWTFHEWAITHKKNIITNSFMSESEDLDTLMRDMIEKQVIDVQLEKETMNLFIFFEDYYEIIFRPILSSAHNYCLWGFHSLSSHKIIWVNTISEIIIRDTYNGDEKTLERIESHLTGLIGQQVNYSSCGGGNGSILLLETNSKDCIWAWGYWRIYKGDTVLGCSEDDDTPITGKMAVAARQLEGSKIKDVILDKDTLDLSLLFENSCRWDIITSYNEQSSLCNWEYWIKGINLCYKITSILTIEAKHYS